MFWVYYSASVVRVRPFVLRSWACSGSELGFSAGPGPPAPAAMCAEGANVTAGVVLGSRTRELGPCQCQWPQTIIIIIIWNKTRQTGFCFICNTTIQGYMARARGPFTGSVSSV
jgi:hypothetical protein